MAARIAGFGLPRRVVVVCRRVVVQIGWCWMFVLVRSRPVMVLRVIVLRVLVHVHRRSHGG